ncbi:hypothetical protein E2542_SST05091 [Spatholobus suberectus]|nr:hypothetical protein E2542_SST05091 [Spatholobus suberectus]
MTDEGNSIESSKFFLKGRIFNGDGVLRAQVHLVTAEGSRKLLAYYPSHESPSRTLGETSAATAEENGDGGSVMEEKEDRWGDRLECFERVPGFGPSGFEGGL